MAWHHDRVCAGTIGQGLQGALYGARARRHTDRVRLRFSCRRITDVQGDPGNATSPYGRYIAVVTNSTEDLKLPPRLDGVFGPRHFLALAAARLRLCEFWRGNGDQCRSLADVYIVGDHPTRWYHAF